MIRIFAITIFIISILFYSMSVFAQPPASFPDIIFKTNSGFGGYGRLFFSEPDKQYKLLDGRINAYVVDGHKIRLMRPDERSGNMDNPDNLVVLDSKLFAPSHYGEINKLDPTTGDILSKYNYADFKFSGESMPKLFASDKVLLVLSQYKIITLDSELDELDEEDIPDEFKYKIVINDDLIQDGDSVFSIGTDNPNTYTDCVDSCNLPTVIRQFEINFSNPKSIKFNVTEEEIAKNEYYQFKSVDTNAKGWIFINGGIVERKSNIEWRKFDDLGNVYAQMTLEKGTQIIAVTKNAPFWAIIKDVNKEKLQLARISIVDKSINLNKYDFDIPSYSDFKIKSYNNEKLYITSGNYLVVYDIRNDSPNIILQQDISKTSLDDFSFANLPVLELKVDRDVLENLLKKDYWDDNDNLRITAEIDKLTPNDAWATEIFTKLLKDRNHSFNGGINYAVRAFDKLGPDLSEPALHDLLYVTIEGAAIRSDDLKTVIPIIVKIDPTGDKIRKLLPECIAKNYECEYVGKEIFAALPKK